MSDPRLTKIAAEVVNGVFRSLPAQVRGAAKAVHVVYEDYADKSVVDQGFEPDILGLFVGDPHGEETASTAPLPPQILLYVRSLWDYADGDMEVYREEVRLTYLHELGHYLGWDEDEVADRGLE